MITRDEFKTDRDFEHCKDFPRFLHHDIIIQGVRATDDTEADFTEFLEEMLPLRCGKILLVQPMKSKLSMYHKTVFVRLERLDEHEWAAKKLDGETYMGETLKAAQCENFIQQRAIGQTSLRKFGAPTDTTNFTWDESKENARPSKRKCTDRYFSGLLQCGEPEETSDNRIMKFYDGHDSTKANKDIDGREAEVE